ncbi:MAG: transglycosylase SLT domain-containing protein, partial [Gammaproteobacteria bacterium]|nr:transglycosylase SLT domain-containing protein [Gammaproteobacteria bacterium]
ERYYARREWHFELPRLSARQTEVAALLAHEWQWYDRAIMALGQSQTLDAMEIRFPLEHLDLVTRYAEKRGMPVALLYSIIRAESAFMQDARSGAGALGLMQLMPATAKETANRIGFRYENANQLLSADANVTLGSAYLKQVYDRFDQSFPMAAGAYNAGPGRIYAWRPKNTCMPADVWIETVPFRETRGYIMRTLFYAAIYEWRLE